MALTIAFSVKQETQLESGPHAPPQTPSCAVGDVLQLPLARHALPIVPAVHVLPHCPSPAPGAVSQSASFAHCTLGGAPAAQVPRRIESHGAGQVGPSFSFEGSPSDAHLLTAAVVNA